MERQSPSWSDEYVEQLLGRLLRWGVLIAAGVVSLGAIVYLRQYGALTPNVATFHGEPAALRSIPGIMRAARDGRGAALIQFGLLLLIATPVARVAFSLVAFFRQRDWLYVGITAFVLALLTFSLVGALA